MDPKSFVFRFGEFEVPERELRLTRAGETLALEPKALRVLLYLLHNPGRLVTKDELLNAVWGDTAVTENSLSRAVALLRKVLDDDIREPRFIATVPTAGYRFIPPVVVSANGNQASAATVERQEIPGATNNEVFPKSKTESQIATIQPPAPARDVVPTQSSTAKRWLVLIAAGLACVIGAAAWYWSRPLPPPRVTEYAQITHNGYIGALAGTDGSRIYFNMNPWGPFAQVGVNGGDIVPISAGSLSATAVDVSSDGARLLLWNPQGIFTMGTAGGPPRFILDAITLTVFYPAFSPDGKSIAYGGPDGSLFSMKVDGTDNTRLATGKGQITDFAWSPDAGHLRFTRDNALWDISSTGGNIHAVFPNWKGPAGQCCGRWTPDGDFYLFLAGGNQDGPYLGGFEQIWARDERRPLFGQTSRAPMQLTSGPIHWGRPIPSQDGKKIFAVGTTPRAELVRLDVKSKQIEPYLGGISAGFLSFSRDGSQIAYVTHPDGILWRAKADGTERVQLTSPPIYAGLCHWSLDGTQILFSEISPRYRLYTVAARGGSLRLVASGDDAVDGYWSPDGKKIVYNVWSQQPELRILDVESGKVSKIPGSDGLWSPRWSPDGRFIAAMTAPFLKIRLFDLRSQRWSDLTQNTGTWGFPNWSHDGKSIYALNWFKQWSAIYRIPVPGGEPQKVADLTGLHLIEAVEFFFGLDPNDVPLLLRDNGSSDIYALTLERK